MKKEATDEEEDPLMVLGYGIVAYRDILWYMFVVFTAISLLQLPAYYVYHSGLGYALFSSASKGSELYSLGNLGYSSS